MDFDPNSVVSTVCFGVSVEGGAKRRPERPTPVFMTVVTSPAIRAYPPCFWPQDSQISYIKFHNFTSIFLLVTIAFGKTNLRFADVTFRVLGGLGVSPDLSFFNVCFQCF